MQTLESDKTQKHFPFPWKRLLIITVLFLFLVLGTIVLLLSTGHIIDYAWYYVIPVIFAIIVGPMLTALQWLFPLSPLGGQTRTDKPQILPQSTLSTNP